MAALQPCDSGLGHAKAPGKLCLCQFRRRASAHKRLDQRELVIGSSSAAK